MSRKAWVLCAAAALSAACVPLEDLTIKRGMIHPRQPTLLLVFAAPSPWVTAGEDSKVETAAKILPGLAMVVQSAQEESAQKASDQLKVYLPAYRPEAKLYAPLQKELDNISYPGVLVSTGPECELTPEVLGRFNRAKNTLEWRARYYVAQAPEIRPFRNYSAFLSLDSSLVLEVNVLPLLSSGAEGAHAPALSAVSRLYRAGTMKLLWSHEDLVEDKAAGKFLQEFMAAPGDLIASYERLAPQLAKAVAASLRLSLGPAEPTAPAREAPTQP